MTGDDDGSGIVSDVVWEGVAATTFAGLSVASAVSDGPDGAEAEVSGAE